MSSIHTDEGLFFELLIPVPASPDALPGVRRVPLQLPADATLWALRKAALRCGGHPGHWGHPGVTGDGKMGENCGKMGIEPRRCGEIRWMFLMNPFFYIFLVFFVG